MKRIRFYFAKNFEVLNFMPLFIIAIYNKKLYFSFNFLVYIFGFYIDLKPKIKIPKEIIAKMQENLQQ